MIQLSLHSRKYLSHPVAHKRGRQARRVRVHAISELLLPASCVAGASCVSLSALDLLSKVTEKSPEQRLEVDKADEDDEFSWTVATAVSFIPGFNWLVCHLRHFVMSEPTLHHISQHLSSSAGYCRHG